MQGYNVLMNKIQKGNRNELLARKKLIDQGYIVEKKNRNRFESPDFWKLFDIIAINIKNGSVKLVQVKSNKSHYYKAIKDIALWKKELQLSDNVNCEVWLKENKKEFKINVI